MLSFVCLLPADSPWRPCSLLRDCYGLTFSFTACRSLARLCREYVCSWNSGRSLVMLSVAGWPAWEQGCVPVVPLWALGVPVSIPGVVLWVAGLCPSLSMSKVWGSAGAGWLAASWRRWSGMRRETAVRTQEHPELGHKSDRPWVGCGCQEQVDLYILSFPASMFPFSWLFSSKCLSTPLAEAGSDLYHWVDLQAGVGTPWWARELPRDILPLLPSQCPSHWVKPTVTGQGKVLRGWEARRAQFLPKGSSSPHQVLPGSSGCLLPCGTVWPSSH